ncbi:MAG TPA: asparagine synthase (glutamine-hydrolyzing) [Pyrinomonadaceae bacterium]
MCGICGFSDMVAVGNEQSSRQVLEHMTSTLMHRGPDESGFYLQDGTGLGFRRLSLIDLSGGNQPLFNEDNSLVLICNGEIFNYRELRAELINKGHRFNTNTDVEVLLHLYEEYGVRLFDKLNGQFAFALYDQRQRQLLLARDHFGINPLYYSVVNDTLIFGSEIKAILAHPLAPREVDLTGLDQVLTLPGLVSPRTMFKGIHSLPAGHYLMVKNGKVELREFWDLNYPKVGEVCCERSEQEYIDELHELFASSVKLRLNADVPVGFYLSGGLDSSLIAGQIHQLYPNSSRHSFSIDFQDRSFSEGQYQRLMAQHVGSVHHETTFDWSEIEERLAQVIYHCECPLKETYNTASIALSEAAKNAGIKAILTGEGADELFAGYVGYRFDRFRQNNHSEYNLDAVLESEVRLKLWGDENLFYEKDYLAYDETKLALYSAGVGESFKDFNFANFDLVNRDRLAGRHYIHQRSYLDFKLRMADHLLSDHGDKMALANSVEARYPFLDLPFVEFTRTVPPNLKLNQFTEKYALRRIAERVLPKSIARREKYAFVAPGSPHLLNRSIDWIEDLLSFERIKREGYFNPVAVESLKQRYRQPGFALDLPFETDLLMIVLTFGLFLETFKMPHLN